MIFIDPTRTVHWIRMPGSRGKPQCDCGGYVANPKETAAVVPEFIGRRPLDTEANYTTDAFTYGNCPRCGSGQLQLVLVSQDLFGHLVPSDL